MNIVQFLIESQNQVLKILQDIDQNLTDPERAQETIRKHISHYELHESLEENFLQHVQKVFCMKEQSFMIHFCHMGNARIWGHLDRLARAADSSHLPAMRQAFSEFAAFEESHFNFKVRSFFPLLQRLMDHRALESLGRRALNFYRRYHPTLTAPYGAQLQEV